MVEVFTDEVSYRNSLERAIKRVCGEMDAYVVYVDLIISPSDNRMDHRGLDLALALLDPAKKPIILYGLDDESYLSSDPRFISLMEKQRVGYITASFELKELKVLYEKLLKE